ncbi:hypothetical protein [Mesobacterium pallidum]|uniref:hypothetical protein n=1 Tax=Mesobacterium pallidum TaxID=2872037 RepID=UPI001EE250B5|nr:hypothetical protein [Mesobacterium pallidum]
MITSRAGQGAEPFDDILDGYFTLKESVRQLMARHQLSWAWLVLSHAPVMEIAGLAPDAPVPLHLRDGHAGVIDALFVTVLYCDATGEHDISLTGSGDWRWLDGRGDAALPADIRLAEPAYVMGFGLSSRPNARRIEAGEILTVAATLVSDGPGFRPFSA